MASLRDFVVGGACALEEEHEKLIEIARALNDKWQGNATAENIGEFDDLMKELKQVLLAVDMREAR